MNVMNRREFVRGVGAAAGAGLLGGCEWMRLSKEWIKAYGEDLWGK